MQEKFLGQVCLHISECSYSDMKLTTVCHQGDQSNESAIEQAKDEQISDVSRVDPSRLVADQIWRILD